MEQHSDLRTPRPTRALIGVCLFLGLLGLLSLTAGVRFLLDPPDEPNAAVGPLLIGAILTGIGFIMPFVITRAQRTSAFRQQMRHERPGEPWAWREDWQSGRIKGSSVASSKVLWLFALIWNAFTWPVAWLFLTQKSGEPGIQLILFFPAVGVVILILAVRGTLQARKYGTSMLVLKTTPGAIGRTIEGDIETRITNPPPGGFDVRLRCVRRTTTGRGKHRRTDRRTLWMDHVTVPAPDLSRGPTGVRVPVAFAIPRDLPASYDHDPDDRIEWDLVVNAATEGVDYSDVFEVPVFATGAPPLTDAERDVLMAGRRAHAAAFVPQTPVMRTRPAADGGVTYAFKPEVKVSSAAGAIVMTVLSWVATVYLVRSGIPVAPFIVGFFAVLFTVGTIVALFHRSAVHVRDGVVVIRHRVLGVGTTRRFDPGDIVDVRSEVVGEGNAQSWEVKVFRRDGKSFSAGAMIPSQVEADWSAEQLRQAIVGARAAHIA